MLELAKAMAIKAAPVTPYFLLLAFLGYFLIKTVDKLSNK